MTWRDPKILFLVQPDWREGVVTLRSWQTSITRSKTDYEQRTGLKQVPLRGLRFSISALTHKEMAYLMRKVKRQLSVLMGVPYWTEGVMLTSEAAGTLTLNVTSTTGREFTVDRLVVLFNPDDPDDFEVSRVATVTASQITLKIVVTGPWPAGTMVYPLLATTMQSNIEVQEETDTVVKSSIEVVEALEWGTSTTETTTSTSTSTTTTSSSTTTTEPPWVQYFDNSDWTPYSGSATWVTDHWESVGAATIELTPIGTWANGYRPTKCRVAHNKTTLNTVTIMDATGVTVYGQATSYVSGAWIPLTCTGDIGRFDADNSVSFNITNIEFAV